MILYIFIGPFHCRILLVCSPSHLKPWEGGRPVPLLPVCWVPGPDAPTTPASGSSDSGGTESKSFKSLCQCGQNRYWEDEQGP